MKEEAITSGQTKVDPLFITTKEIRCLTKF
jgi:hypothetical protein